MSLSKVILGAAEKMRPVLIKCIPQRILSTVKAKVISKGAKDIENVEFEPFDRHRFCDGVNLIGDIRADTGLGQSMRYVSFILDNSSYPHLIYNYYVPPGISMTDTSCDDKIESEIRYNINIIHINPSEMPVAYMALGKEVWDYHYNIGHWVWELEDFPTEWMPAFSLVNELFVPSEFVRNIFKKYTDKPVTALPFPVTAPVDETFDREYFGLPKDRFLFLMMFDSGSGMERKNPLGIIESFKKAFVPNDERVGLVIKLNKSVKSQKDMEYIKTLLKGYHNIYFVCENFSRVEVNSLIKASDVYVSLHRAEGFGLVMAEAMTVGTPVIATAWSGNMQFMNEKSACLVDYTMIELQKDNFPFKKGYRWADADTSQAAAYMRKLAEDEKYYHDIRDYALQYIKETLSMQKAASIINERVESILNMNM